MKFDTRLVADILCGSPGSQPDMDSPTTLRDYFRQTVFSINNLYRHDAGPDLYEGFKTAFGLASFIFETVPKVYNYQPYVVPKENRMDPEELLIKLCDALRRGHEIPVAKHVSYKERDYESCMKDALSFSPS